MTFGFSYCFQRSHQRNEFNNSRSSPLHNSSALSKTNPFQSPPAVSCAGGNYPKSTAQSQSANHNVVSHHHPSPNIIYSNPYDSSGYLQMALGAYLAPTSGGAYKSVDPYFLSQGALSFGNNDIIII